MSHNLENYPLSNHVHDETKTTVGNYLNLIEKHVELLNIVRNMRQEQKGFYAAKQGTLARSEHFKASREWETKADKFLKDLDEPKQEKTPTLF